MLQYQIFCTEWVCHQYIFNSGAYGSHITLWCTSGTPFLFQIKKISSQKLYFKTLQSIYLVPDSTPTSCIYIRVTYFDWFLLSLTGNESHPRFLNIIFINKIKSLQIFSNAQWWYGKYNNTYVLLTYVLHTR